MPNDQQPNEKTSDEALTPDLVGRLITAQEKQLTLSLQEQEANHRYAMASLEYDSRDRKEERTFILKLINGQRILAGSIIGSVLVFTGIILAMGKDAIAVEILKASAFFLAGGSLGWGLHRRAKRPSEE